MQPFSINRIALSLLPVALRRPVLCALLRAGLSAIGEAYARIDTAHNHALRGTYAKLRRTGQVCIMEAELNRLHDPQQRRISVEPMALSSMVYVYTHIECYNQPGYYDVWLHDGHPVVLCRAADAVEREPMSFVVLVPAELQTASLRTDVEGMAVAGTHCRIHTPE